MPSSSLYQPPRHQSSNGGGAASPTAVAAVAVQGLAQVEPNADTISNRISLPPSSLLPITNPRMTTSRINYQYDPVPAEGYDVKTMPPESYQHRTYMQQGYTQSFPGPDIPKYNGRPMADTMGILGSEQYDDRMASRRSIRKLQEPMISLFGLVQEREQEQEQREVMPTRKKVQVHRSQDAENGVGERQRKKQKLSSEDEGDEDAAKKSRGRPRLDTKDETAADRRRTQIRMAQRAYRHRKETTISSLEKQVQELRNANDQMSQIFISLQDFAVGTGLLQREPEFGDQLKSATEHFLALAKSVSEENSKDEDGTSLDGSKPSNSDADLEHANHREESKQTSPHVTQQGNLPAIEPSLWGYQVTREENRIDPMGEVNQMDQMDWNQQPYMGSSRQDHQIISRATFDNASFGFDYFDNENNLQLYRAEIPDVNDYQYLATFQETLPLPKTLSHRETTFGRHLQRAALESGWKLITAENPNPKRINDVFGFCLRFETLEDIGLRLKRAMEANSKDSLYAWRAPFVHLGGAGTYYPLDEHLDGSTVPKFKTGMSIGPFPRSVINTRETAMFDDFRINLPGFEGEFFDSNDVEGYLRGRGIDIPPNVEFVTVDLDQFSIHDIPSPESLSDSNTIKPHSPETPRTPEARFTELTGQDESHMDDFMMNMPSNDVDMNFFLPFPEWNSEEPIKASPNPFDLTGPIFNSTPTPETPNNERPHQDRHLVTLSVTDLIQELLTKATCLGRAPGFRPTDVESALRKVLRRAF